MTMVNEVDKVMLQLYRSSENLLEKEARNG